MKESKPTKEESIGNHLIEDISQIQQIALGEGAVACQVCGTPLSGGSPVSVYVYRPAGESTFEIGHVVCGDDGHDLTTHFTLGVRELLVDGRVGLCSDVATGACWPVLLDPSVRVVSTMESRAGRIVPETSTDDVPWVYGDALLDRTAEHEPHETPADENPPKAGDETVDGDEADSHADNTTPTDDESPPHAPPSRDDAAAVDDVGNDVIPADAESPPAASTGPAGSADAVPADDDADSSPTDAVDTDEMTADADGGEC